MVIYQDAARQWLWALLLLPCLMLLASISKYYHVTLLHSCIDPLCGSVALGIVALVGITGSSPFAIVNLILAYYVMSLSLNIIVTLLIAGRLLIFRYRMHKIMGPHHTSTYSNIVAILVESAALYSVFAVLFIVPFGLGNPVGNIFLQVVNQVQVRVASENTSLIMLMAG